MEEVRNAKRLKRIRTGGKAKERGRKEEREKV